MRTRVWGLGLAAVALLAGQQATASAAPKAAAPAAAAEVRVNQVGYTTGAAKVAYAMLPARVASVSFTVSGGHGVVLRGHSSDFAGGWNSRYHAVYQLDFSRLRRSGSYRIIITAGGQTATSPAFKVASGAALYHQLVLNGVSYFTSERDGGNVVNSVLDRKPANLTDRKATVYAAARYDDNDNLLGKFHKIGGPVNVAGGWFDAGGGYEKFAYTASYSDALLLLAQRNNPAAYPTLAPEAQFGLTWLQKLWNPTKKVLYIQVGIGTGNASNTIQGDYNFWLRPQAEDKMNVSKGGNPGPTAYYVKYRPVFEAAAPGKKIDPDFAGRFAAAFGLGAQVAARTDRAKAEHLLSLARGIYAMAKTSNIGQLLTTYPDDFYPGTEWKSDMLWGADEIALADEALRAPAATVHADLQTAAYWAQQYIAQGHPAGGDTFNLYDNGAVGEGELLKAMQHAHGAPVVARGVLLTDLAAQLKLGEANSAGRPVRARRPARPERRITPRVRPVHHQRDLPAVRRRSPVRSVRPAAAELRARRQRLGRLVRGRRGHGVPALHAERDRQPVRITDRQGQHPGRRYDGRAERPVLVRRAEQPAHDEDVCLRSLRGLQYQDRQIPGRGGRLAFGTSRPTTTRRTRCWPSPTRPAAGSRRLVG